MTYTPIPNPMPVTGSGTFSTTDVDHLNSLQTIFASAARTATPTAVQTTWLYGNSAKLYFNATVTPNNTETITITIRAIDPASGNAVKLITLHPIVASSLGAAPAAGSGVLVFDLEGLPRAFDILPTHSGSGSWTYSISLHPMLGVRRSVVAPSGASTSTTATATTSDSQIVAPRNRVELKISSPSTASGDVWITYGPTAAVVGTGVRLPPGGVLIETASVEAIRAISAGGSSVTLGIVEHTR